jgi:hypothetical protein
MAFKNWNLATVTASTDTTLAQPASGNIAMMLSLFVKNSSGSTASVIIKVTDSSDSLKGYLFEGDIQDDETMIISEKIVLADQDKLVVQSDQGSTSFFVSGDES